MKNVTIRREESQDYGTFGAWACEGGPSFISLELPWRDNAPDKSCIPSGIYAAKLRYSAHFQKQLYHLIDVPGRSNVECHSANFAGDVDLGYHSDLLGCLALGLGRGILTTPEGKPQEAITRSREALIEFMGWADGNDLLISIYDTTDPHTIGSPL